jgi:preprotein translocase subunit SecG
MGVIVTLLTILDVFVAILIIALVLVQQSKKGGGLGTTFGGGGSDSLFGAHASTHLSKLTSIFATIFVVVTLSLAIITGHNYGKRSDSHVSSLLEQSTATVPVKANK